MHCENPTLAWLVNDVILDELRILAFLANRMFINCWQHIYRKSSDVEHCFSEFEGLANTKRPGQNAFLPDLDAVW